MKEAKICKTVLLTCMLPLSCPIKLELFWLRKFPICLFSPKYQQYLFQFVLFWQMLLLFWHWLIQLKNLNKQFELSYSGAGLNRYLPDRYNKLLFRADRLYLYRGLYRSILRL